MNIPIKHHLNLLAEFRKRFYATARMFDQQNKTSCSRSIFLRAVIINIKLSSGAVSLACSGGGNLC